MKKYITPLLWIVAIAIILGGVKANITINNPSISSPVYKTEVYDLEYMDANKIYERMNDMHKQGFKIYHTETYDRLNINFNLYTT